MMQLVRLRSNDKEAKLACSVWRGVHAGKGTRRRMSKAHPGYSGSAPG